MSDVTIGYRYYLGMHMILCHGPIDHLNWIKVDDRIAWSGLSAGGRIAIDAEGLFGGEGREGGVSGDVDLEMGYPNQLQNDYLRARLGAIPNYRGVVGAVLRQCYLGLNPYLKKWAFRARRIYIRQNGLPQWYEEKAAILAKVFAHEALAAVSVNWELVAGPWVSGNVYEVDFEQSSPQTQTRVYKSGTGGIDTVTLRLTGRVERKEYEGATRIAGPVVQGGTPNPRNAYNIYQLSVSDPPNHFYLNDGVSMETTQPIQSDDEPGGVTFSIPIRDGATVTLSWNDGGDGRMIDQKQNVRLIGEGIGEKTLAHYDMNPAHILRECLTDPDWGMGYAEADLDDESFRAAADTLWEERMGISLLWDRQMPIESFIQEIVKHIDAALYVDRTTGKFVLKLVRADYDASKILKLGPHNVQKIDNPSRPTFGELVNSISVNYWDAETGKPASLTVEDTAMVQMQGAVINTAVQYPGFSNHDIASRVGLRDLRTLSTPLFTGTVYANRDAAHLNIGDVFELTWPDYELHGVVMRVTGLAFGDGKNNQVRIAATQDVFTTPLTGVIANPGDGWVEPGGPPVPAANRLLLEAPYLKLVRDQGQAWADDTLGADPSAGYLVAASAPAPNAINAELAVDAGSGFASVGTLDFCPTAVLAAPVDPVTITFEVAQEENLDEVTLGTVVQVEDELCSVVAVDITAGTVTVGRGVLDTTPCSHAAGARLYFWGTFSLVDPTQYLDGETVAARIRPTTNQGTLPLADAPEDLLTLRSRAIRPYPPGRLRLDGEDYPPMAGGVDLVVSWAHRDRTQQTGGTLIDAMAGHIGPEPGTEYQLRVLDEFGVQQQIFNNIMLTSQLVHLGDLPSDKATVEVRSLRGIHECWQPARHTFRFPMVRIVTDHLAAIRQVPYHEVLVIAGGTAPLTFSVVSGSLPPGLSLNPVTGAVEGTPTAAGSYSFTIGVEDADGRTDARPFNMKVGTLLSLMHYEGADGSATFKDAVAGRTWNIRTGSPRIRTAWAAFGSSSLEAPASSSIGVTPKPVIGASDDFTIEFFFRSLSNTSGGVFACWTGSQGVLITRPGVDWSRIRFICQNSAVAEVDLMSAENTMVIGQPVFVQARRLGNKFQLALDGQVVAETEVAMSVNWTGAEMVFPNGAHGYFDEFRLVGGAAMPFRVPVGPFPDPV